MKRMAQAQHCPYSLRRLCAQDKSSTFVIRERDEFGEYPNIYAKVYYSNASRNVSSVILSDTGTGLDVMKYEGAVSKDERQSTQDASRWNIATFLSSTINPDHRAPYTVITSHCHYDHIGGISSLLDAKANVTVLASSHDRDWLIPWKHLQKHSLCDDMGLKAPKYDIRWIDNGQTISHVEKSLNLYADTSIVVIHTPGHTPDSLSWYDSDTNVLSVGDMLYERESDETRSGNRGQWDPEPPAPIIFGDYSSIIDWNTSIHKLLAFVRSENKRLESSVDKVNTGGYRQNGQGTAVEFAEELSEENWSLISLNESRKRVRLCAAHVTVDTDAEVALLDVLAFMLRVQLDQVPRKAIKSKRGGNVWLWDDSISQQGVQTILPRTVNPYRYSMQAPWSVIHPTASSPVGQNSLSSENIQRPGFRSILKTITTPSDNGSSGVHLKANASASVSHNNVMASRPALKTRSIPKKG